MVCRATDCLPVQLQQCAEAHYYLLTIAKQNGGRRKLLVPDPLLKGIQQAILRNVLERQPVSPYAMAYHKGAAIRKNAIVHQGNAYGVKTGYC